MAKAKPKEEEIEEQTEEIEEIEEEIVEKKPKTKPKAKEEKSGEFNIKMDNPKIMRGVIEALGSIIDEAVINVDKQEFSIKAMDPSRICLLQLTIKKINFDDYNCPKACKVGLNLDDLDKILKRSNSGDTLEISYKEVEHKLKIKMKKDANTRSRTFSLSTIDVDVEDVPIENLLKIDYNCTWKSDPGILFEALKDGEIYSEILNIKANEKGVSFNSIGQIGEMDYELELEELIDPELNEESTGAYSIIFLKAILKLISITEQLEISLKTDNPLRMIFNLLEGGELFYFLAPRVEEADFDDDLNEEEV